jgi:hypothetical protein
MVGNGEKKRGVGVPCKELVPGLAKDWTLDHTDALIRADSMPRPEVVPSQELMDVINSLERIKAELIAAANIGDSMATSISFDLQWALKLIALEIAEKLKVPVGNLKMVMSYILGVASKGGGEIKDGTIVHLKGSEADLIKTYRDGFNPDFDAGSVSVCDDKVDLWLNLGEKKLIKITPSDLQNEDLLKVTIYLEPKCGCPDVQCKNNSSRVFSWRLWGRNEMMAGEE